MKREELILSIKKAGDGRDIELDKLTLADAMMFKELLASFTELLRSYDDASNVRLKIFKSSAAVKLEAEENFIRTVENDIDKALHREPIRTGALKKWQNLQQIISSSNYALEFDIVSEGISRRSLISEFRSKPIPSPKKSRTRRIENIIFIQGKLESLGAKAHLHIMLPNKDTSIRIVCSSEAEARRARDYAYTEVYLCAFKGQTASNESYDFVDVYRDKDELTLVQNFYKDYQKLEGKMRYSTFLDLVYNIMDKDESIEMKLQELLKFVRLFDNINTEEGQLFTMLTSLKSYKNHTAVKQVYENLLFRFKSQSKHKMV